MDYIKRVKKDINTIDEMTIRYEKLSEKGIKSKAIDMELISSLCRLKDNMKAIFAFELAILDDEEKKK